MDAAGSWWTRANAVSSLRLLILLPLVAAILCDSPRLALALLVAAVASDFADGYLARRFGETSPLGGLIDHSVDALFVACGLAALAARGLLTPLLPVLVVATFAQYAFDSRAHEGRPLRGSALGRWNGLAYYGLLLTPITRDALGLAWPGPALVAGVAWLLVATSLLSAADRLRH